MAELSTGSSVSNHVHAVASFASVSGAAYTDMVDDLGTIRSQACIGHNGSNGSTCTGWY